MNFKWICPYCDSVYQYEGRHTKLANSKCSNSKCINRRNAVKIWQYRIESTCLPEKVDKTEFTSDPSLKLGKKGPYPILNTDELRYLHKRLIGSSIRDKPELILNSFIYNLIEIKRRKIYE
jgi:hypothetical protein